MNELKTEKSEMSIWLSKELGEDYHTVLKDARRNGKLEVFNKLSALYKKYYKEYYSEND